VKEDFSSLFFWQASYVVLTRPTYASWKKIKS